MKQERRFVLIEVDAQSVVSAARLKMPEMGIPDDVDIRSVEFDYRRSVFLLSVAHESFAEVPVGGEARIYGEGTVLPKMLKKDRG